MTGIINQSDKGGHVTRGPFTPHQRFTGGLRIGRRADNADHLVDIGNGNRQTHQDMGAITRFAQQEFGAAADNLLAEIHKGADHVENVHELRTTTRQRDHVATEGRLHGREFPELVQHDLAHRIALQFDDDAHAVAVRFIAQIGNALDAFFTHEIGHFFDEAGLVHLIGNFGDDDGFTILADLLNRRPRPHDHRTTTGMIG